ncbi:MAG: ATP-binding protein [Polyangiaceae bacterium]|nr:ATP-binding protein [Polyangiaceae bacterium]
MPAAAGPRRFISLGTKLSALIVALLVIVFAFIYVEATTRTRENLIETKQLAAVTVADLIARSLAAPLEAGNRNAVQAEVNRYAESPDIIYVAVWKTGAETPLAVLLTEGRGRITGMPASREPHNEVLSDRVEVVRNITAAGGRALGGMVLHVSLARENEAYDERQGRLLVLSLGLTLALSALLIGVTRRILILPLARLAEAARRLEWGTLAKVEVVSSDEIGNLGSAFNAMADAIALRETWIAAARSSLQEVLDNMRQAIVVFGREGLVEGASSRLATRIFQHGSLHGGSLQGRRIRDLLYPGAVEHDIELIAFNEWLRIAFDAGRTGWDEIAELAPREVRVRQRNGETVILELEFRPVLEDERVARIMLLATDATDRRKLELAMHAQERQHALQMAAMRRLIASGAQLFVSFLHGAKERLARCRAIVGAGHGSLSSGAIDEIFRHVHTIKGEAGAFDLQDLAEAAAAIEERLAELCGLAQEGARVSLFAHDLRSELRERLDAAEGAVEDARRLFVAASPIGAAVLDQVTVSRSALLKLRELIRARAAAGRVPVVPVEDLAPILATVASRPFGESAAQLPDAAVGWASSVGKQVEVEIDGREVLVPEELAAELSGVLMHLVRNAIAHGIELPEERVRLGKPPAGRIRVLCAEDDSGLSIAVDDDGRGVDVEALLARASELHLPMPPGGPFELVFAQSLSTAEGVSDIAGRGVGLAAVRSELNKIGWEIALQSESSRGSRFVVTRRRSDLPRSAV